MCDKCDYHRGRVAAERYAGEHGRTDVRSIHLRLAELHEQRLAELSSNHRPAVRGTFASGLAVAAADIAKPPKAGIAQIALDRQQGGVPTRPASPDANQPRSPVTGRGAYRARSRLVGTIFKGSDQS